MDRQNVGGSASGQQSNFVARGAAMREQKWNLDGVDITDMSATGGSPVYFDFDAFEEMQISTGGADVTMQSPGVGVNLVTKSGTDKLRGSGRFYVTDDSFQAINVDDELRRQGAAHRQPDPEHQGLRHRGRRPDREGPRVDLGQLRQAGHQRRHQQLLQGRRRVPGDEGESRSTYSIEEIRDVPQPRHDAPEQLQPRSSRCRSFTNNQFSLFFNAAEKVRNARDASDLRPLETTYRQLGVTRERPGLELVEDRDAEELQVDRPAHLQRPVHDRGLVRARRATTSR